MSHCSLALRVDPRRAHRRSAPCAGRRRALRAGHVRRPAGSRRDGHGIGRRQDAGRRRPTSRGVFRFADASARRVDAARRDARLRAADARGDGRRRAAAVDVAADAQTVRRDHARPSAAASAGRSAVPVSRRRAARVPHVRRATGSSLGRARRISARGRHGVAPHRGGRRSGGAAPADEPAAAEELRAPPTDSSSTAASTTAPRRRSRRRRPSATTGGAAGRSSTAASAFVLGNSAFDSRPFSFGAPADAKARLQRRARHRHVRRPLRFSKVLRNGPTLFVAVQHADDHNATTQPGVMPTLLERGGDFSQSVDASGRPLQIVDPLTGQPFAGNVIPSSRISPQAAALLGYYPRPNLLARQRLQLSGAAHHGDAPGSRSRRA